MVIKIWVFGGEVPCARCKATEKVVKEAASELKLDVEIAHVSALSEQADKYDILSTPAVVVNDKLLISGKVPDKETMKDLLWKEFGSK